MGFFDDILDMFDPDDPTNPAAPVSKPNQGTPNAVATAGSKGAWTGLSVPKQVAGANSALPRQVIDKPEGPEMDEGLEESMQYDMAAAAPKPAAGDQKEGIFKKTILPLLLNVGIPTAIGGILGGSAKMIGAGAGAAYGLQGGLNKWGATQQKEAERDKALAIAQGKVDYQTGRDGLKDSQKKEDQKIARERNAIARSRAARAGGGGDATMLPLDRMHEQVGRMFNFKKISSPEDKAAAQKVLTSIPGGRKLISKKVTPGMLDSVIGGDANKIDEAALESFIETYNNSIDSGLMTKGTARGKIPMGYAPVFDGTEDDDEE